MIEVEHLTYVYPNGTKAIDDLSFCVEDGEIIGLLGPNGAGKSTFVKIITGHLKPTKGTVKVSGFDMTSHTRDVRRLIGVMPQETALYQNLTAQETLEYHADIYDVPLRSRNERIEEMLTLAGLKSRRNDLVKTYSGGMRRRLALVRALLHDSELLILDEMSLGVDVHSRNLIWQQVKELRRKGKTVLFCTNYMDEADELADRLLIIDHGRLIAEGSPLSLKREYVGNFIIELEIGNLSESQDSAWLCKQIGFEAELVSERRVGNTRILQIQSENGYKDLPKIISTLSGLGMAIKEAAMRSPSLGDVFLSVTGSKLRD